jgi:hypothetical protein
MLGRALINMTVHDVSGICILPFTSDTFLLSAAELEGSKPPIKMSATGEDAESFPTTFNSYNLFSYNPSLIILWFLLLSRKFSLQNSVNISRVSNS